MKELISFVETNFNLDIHVEEDLEGHLDFLQRKLSDKIKFLIRTDLDKLLQILYRIDVDDSLSSKAFDLGEISRVSDELAKLIIQRQLVKLDYREKYSGTKR